MTPGWEHRAGGTGGGFAALGALLRRVTGVSRLYWCNSLRLAAPSTGGELDRAPLMVQSPRLVGGFAPLDASCRRVAGVSHLYCCNSPRLLAVRSRFGVLRSRFGVVRTRFRAVRSRFGAVRSRFKVAWRTKCRPPRRQTPTMGCCGRGGLRCGHTDAWPRVEVAREPLNMRGNPLDTHVNLSTCAWAALPTRESSNPRARCRAQARMSGPTCARVH